MRRSRRLATAIAGIVLGLVPMLPAAGVSSGVIAVPAWPAARIPTCDGAMFAAGSPDVIYADNTAPAFISVTMTPKVAIGPTTNAYIHIYAHVVDICSGVGQVAGYVVANGQVLNAVDPLLPANTDAFNAEFSDTVGHLTPTSTPGVWSIQNVIAFDRYSQIRLTPAGAYVSSVSRDTTSPTGRLYVGPKPVCYVVRASYLPESVSATNVRKGATIAVNGHLVYWHGAWINRVGVPVVLQRPVGNTAAWVNVASQLTNASGAVRFTVVVPVSTYYRLVYLPNIALGYDSAVDNPMAVRAV